MKDIKTVLIAVDFTESPDDLLYHTHTFVPDKDVKVYLIHIIEDIQQQVYYSEIPPIWTDFKQDIEESAFKHQEQYLGTLRSYYNDVESIIEFGNIPESILNYGKKFEVDLVIVGTHGRKGIDHFVHSNVAEKVVRRAKRPVLTFYINQ